MFANIFSGFSPQQSPMMRRQGANVASHIFQNMNRTGGGLQMQPQQNNSWLSGGPGILGGQAPQYMTIRDVLRGGNAAVLNKMRSGGQNMANSARSGAGAMDVMSLASRLRSMLGGM